jgi:hypothetical protein
VVERELGTLGEQTRVEDGVGQIQLLEEVLHDLLGGVRTLRHVDTVLGRHEQLHARGLGGSHHARLNVQGERADCADNGLNTRESLLERILVVVVNLGKHSAAVLELEQRRLGVITGEHRHLEVLLEQFVRDDTTDATRADDSKARECVGHNEMLDEVSA